MTIRSCTISRSPGIIKGKKIEKGGLHPKQMQAALYII